MRDKAVEVKVNVFLDADVEHDDELGYEIIWLQRSLPNFQSYYQDWHEGITPWNSLQSGSMGIFTMNGLHSNIAIDLRFARKIYRIMNKVCLSLVKTSKMYRDGHLDHQFENGSIMNLTADDLLSSRLAMLRELLNVKQAWWNYTIKIIRGVDYD